MNDPDIIWQRTFPDSAPGTDGVALFEGRVIGRVQLLANAPRDPKPWSWSVTDPELAGRPGWGNTHGEIPSRRQAMALPIEARAGAEGPSRGLNNIASSSAAKLNCK